MSNMSLTSREYGFPKSGTSARAMDPFTHGTRWLMNAWRKHQESRANAIAIAQLRALDDRILKDIGLHRGEIASAVLNPPDERRIRFHNANASHE